MIPADRMARLGTESAFEVLARAKALERQGKDVVHLEIGEPDFDTPAHIREVPAPHLTLTHPGRDRPLKDLAYHVFRLSLGFADAMDFGGFRPEWLEERAPADLTDGAGVARYGGLVRGRLAGWFEGAGPSELERVIEAYYGPQSGHELLERTTWHAAQHLRQLHALLDGVGAPPAAPLPVADFQGLPLPDSLW